MFERDGSKRLGPAEVLIVVFVGLLVLAVVVPAAQKSRFDAYRAACGNYLSAIGKAISVYAGDYDGQFPRSGGRNTLWATAIPAWNATNRYQAYGLATDASGGRGTISSCFYLLVKYAGVAPSTFVCPGDVGTTVFDPAGAGVGDRELSGLWDFGPDAANHCSYAYHLPFDLYALNTAFPPGVAVAADRNPWMGSPSAEAKEMALFIPTGGREAIKAGNAAAHGSEGQNVLFLDGHVAFEKEPFCGVSNDNIYTFWDGTDIRRGGKPFLTSCPKDRTDSFLVNDPLRPRPKAVRKEAKAVNSADLKRTGVVATLDCPMPEHKNVIWCATFQMTWDKLKNGIIGEPLIVPDAAELAARLNQAEFPVKNLEPKSFYARVGIVKDGIVEQIRKEMGTRFPSEPVPTFDELNRLPPGIKEMTIISYSYLTTDIGFKYPFYSKEGAFSFEDSSSTRTGVTSFCEYTEGPDPNEGLVREQVDILYYEGADQAGAAEFAVDLCKHTNPYQVVLALVPRDGTIREIVTGVEQKMAEFKTDPNYEVLRKLRPGSVNRLPDRLIVPDVLYKLTHRFAELKGKQIKNPEWKDYWFLEAREIVDFALSRTGVVLKSEARLTTPPPFAMRPRRLEEPRYFYFNRPFLIYVKKRGAEYSPFFVMWVDNAELMNKF